VDNRNFVIVSVARSGSNLLRDYLNQHGNIRCFGEIFKKSFIKGGKPWRTLSGGSEELKHLHQTDLVAFWKLTLDKYNLDKPVIGAKIFYYHRHGEEIWRYFASSYTPIIHLVREQLIDSYLSQKLAKASGVWKQVEGKRIDTEYERSISVDLADFQYYCARFQRHFASIKLLFRDNPYLEITYSALAKERAQTMSAIYSFLGLPDREATPRFVKQLSRPREEVILNWDEVGSFIKSNRDLCVVH
jgi:LPS sulfotransferase NodH